MEDEKRYERIIEKATCIGLVTEWIWAEMKEGMWKVTPGILESTVGWVIISEENNVSSRWKKGVGIPKFNLGTYCIWDVSKTSKSKYQMKRWVEKCWAQWRRLAWVMKVRVTYAKMLIDVMGRHEIAELRSFKKTMSPILLVILCTLRILCIV